ncbi:putative P-loop containing nucleoside triphosphate hydrolase, TIR domain-containing protein [Helianthus debilis subsp. tardiflorus]
MLHEIGFNGKHNEELWSALLSDWELEKALKFIVDQEALFRRVSNIRFGACIEKASSDHLRCGAHTGIRLPDAHRRAGTPPAGHAPHTREYACRTRTAARVHRLPDAHRAHGYTPPRRALPEKALKDAANLSGWELKNTADGHEAKVIKLIVERVSLELRSINMDSDEKLVGMEQRMQDLDPYLQIGLEDVRMVGIKGMGGAGKRTLARAIFDKLSINFEAKSFVEDVRENSKAPLLGMKKLQEQVLKDVLGDKSITVSSVHEGTNLMKMMFCGKKVLIVLDDVDHRNQLERLAGNHNWFKLGSRIIITTRDEQVLIAHGVKYIHDVNLLSNEEAIRLFCRHAFREEIPTEE